MAVGPLARLLAQLVVPVIAVLAKAIPAAYQQALQNARKAGVSHHEAASDSVKNMLRKTISKSEALQILNLTEETATAEAIQKQFEKYMAANDVKNGGSFYLQSKVYRAKELLDEFVKEKRMEEKENNQQQQQQHKQQTSSSSSSSSEDTTSK